MIISTQTNCLALRFGKEKAIEIIKNSGFDAFDLTLFGMRDRDDIFNSDRAFDYAKKLRAYADSLGISCNQAHAAYPVSPSQIDADFYRETSIRGMKIAAIMGAKIIVVHPFHNTYYLQTADQLAEYNHEFYSSLTPYCEEYGIKVALENMWQTDPNRKLPTLSTCSDPKEFCRYLDALDPRYFTACLDIGHCMMTGYEPDYCIRVLGHDRIGALHVHDNNLIDDQHYMPFVGRQNWDRVTEALAQINYTGDLTLEADKFLRAMPDGILHAAEQLMAAAARELATMITTKQNLK